MPEHALSFLFGACVSRFLLDRHTPPGIAPGPVLSLLLLSVLLFLLRFGLVFVLSCRRCLSCLFCLLQARLHNLHPRVVR
jgi:hypothetical protein